MSGCLLGCTRVDRSSQSDSYQTASASQVPRDSLETLVSCRGAVQLTGISECAVVAVFGSLLSRWLVGVDLAAATQISIVQRLASVILSELQSRLPTGRRSLRESTVLSAELRNSGLSVGLGQPAWETAAAGAMRFATSVTAERLGSVALRYCGVTLPRQCAAYQPRRPLVAWAGAVGEAGVSVAATRDRAPAASGGDPADLPGAVEQPQVGRARATGGRNGGADAGPAAQSNVRRDGAGLSGGAGWREGSGC